MAPIVALHINTELSIAPLEEAASIDLFGPKVGLMDKFKKKKIAELARVLD
jgi:hypothetical protein